MNVHLDCFPCFLKQAITTLGYVDMEQKAKIDIVNSVLDEIKIAEIDKTPAHATTFVYRKIKELIHRDPYKEIKYRYNEKTLRLYQNLKKNVFESDNPLWTAARMAIAGNIMDFGLFQSFDIEGTVRHAINNGLDIDDFKLFSEEVEKYSDMIYLLDNSGEIVFDKLLIEILLKKGKKITAVVKGDAVINDVTMDDAVQVGLNEICRVIDNGSDAVGTILEWSSEEFRNEFNKNKLIISKGQGNFETLLQSDKNIFFLFQAKCDVVAGEIGRNKGAMILMGKDSRYRMQNT